MEDRKGMPEASGNLYEAQKTIRFELVPVEGCVARPHVTGTPQDSDHALIAGFVSDYMKAIGILQKTIFNEHLSTGERWLRKGIKVKFGWLKTYAKSEYYEAKDRIVKLNARNQKVKNQIEINDKEVGFLMDTFDRWLRDNLHAVEILSDLISKPEQSQSKRSDFGYWHHFITKRSNFECIHELFNGNIQDASGGEGDERIKEAKKILDGCREKLDALGKSVLPSQSMGMVIERTSLNYYTVNKKPKDYQKEYEMAMRRLGQPIGQFTARDGRPHLNMDSSEFTLYLESTDADHFVSKNGLMKKSFANLRIESAYEIMKRFKAEQKSAFHEAIKSSDRSLQNIRNNPQTHLFGDISTEKFEKLLADTEDIEQLSTERSVMSKDDSERIPLEKRIKALKMERGKIFNVQSRSDCAFTKYRVFCDVFKQVAFELGRIKAKIKGLEKERLDALKIDSWGCMLGHNGDTYLLTFPRDSKDTLQRARDQIVSLHPEQGDWTLYRFESLTLRALDKLCFGSENNSFRPDMKTELQSRKPEFFQLGKLMEKFDFAGNDAKLLEFYQAVLGLTYSKRNIVIDSYPGFEALLNTRFESLEAFDRLLKQTCYLKLAIPISEKTKDHLIGSFKGNLFKITSYDLRGDRQNPEEHTRIWWNFWNEENQKNRYPIRVNPEIRISFVAKDKKLLESDGFWPNRKLRDRYLMATTVTLNAHEKRADFALKEKDEVMSFLYSYNSELNRSLGDPHSRYYYGLDRGENELVSMGVYRFSAGDRFPELAGIDVLMLKEACLQEQDSRGRIAYKNLSYFLEREDIFERQTLTSCMDLSCAKLIKDRIIMNGDIQTYLRLKELSAKRKIFEGFSRSEFTGHILEVDPSGRIFSLPKKDGWVILYVFDERYASIVPLETVRSTLQKAIDDIRTNNAEKDIISITQVNNLRDAICANMVGIIAHLRKKFPGMIIFEDWNTKDRQSRVEKNAVNLASRIEWKLLQKFQSLGLIPPTYKQVMRLKDEGLKQVGIIGYIKTENTSILCPICDGKLYGHGRGPELEHAMHHCTDACDHGWEKNKKSGSPDKNHHLSIYAGGSVDGTACTFHMRDNPQGFDFLKSGDDLATYNIARKGLTLMLDPKTHELPPKKEKNDRYNSEYAHHDHARDTDTKYHQRPSSYADRSFQKPRPPQQETFKRSSHLGRR